MQASTLLCSFCGLSGHLIDTCHRFHSAKSEATKDAQQRQEQRRSAKKRPNKAHAAQESTPTTSDTSTPSEFAGKASSPSSPPSSLPQTTSDDLWTADKGATSHMTPHKHWLRNYKPPTLPICLANNTVVYSAGVGSVVFAPEVEGEFVRHVELGLDKLTLPNKGRARVLQSEMSN